MANVAIQYQSPPRALFEHLREGPDSEDFSVPENGLVGEFAAAFEVRETARELRIHADVPGVTLGNLFVFVNGRRLTVWGRRERTRESRDLQFHAYERTYGSFWRTFRLSPAVDLLSARAALQRGVLTVCIRKQPTQRPGHEARAEQQQEQHTCLYSA